MGLDGAAGSRCSGNDVAGFAREKPKTRWRSDGPSLDDLCVGPRIGDFGGGAGKMIGGDVGHISARGLDGRALLNLCQLVRTSGRSEKPGPIESEVPARGEVVSLLS